jgi:hypothetical protein
LEFDSDLSKSLMEKISNSVKDLPFNRRIPYLTVVTGVMVTSRGL